jgi:hypothetical protein
MAARSLVAGSQPACRTLVDLRRTEIEWVLGPLSFPPGEQSADPILPLSVWLSEFPAMIGALVLVTVAGWRAGGKGRVTLRSGVSGAGRSCPARLCWRRTVFGWRVRPARGSSLAVGFYTEIVAVRIGRGAAERLNDRRTLVLERASAPALQLDVLGPGMLHELADLLAALTLERAERFERVVLVVPLKEDAVEDARALVSAGPPFDPGERALQRHEVFFTDSEAVFLFEGPDAGQVVQRLARDPGAWRAALRWRRLLAGAPRLAGSAYSWASPPVIPDR